MRTVVRSPCVRPSRLGSNFLDLGPNWAEWTQSMLLWRQTVCIWTVWAIDRLLQADRIIFLRVRLLRRTLGHDVGCHIIGLVIPQERGVKSGTKWHVVQSITCGCQEAAHSSTVV